MFRLRTALPRRPILVPRSFATKFSRPTLEQVPVSSQASDQQIPRSFFLILAGAVLSSLSAGVLLGTSIQVPTDSAAAPAAVSISQSPYALSKRSAAEYPPAFGSKENYQKGIDELKEYFASLGRGDDVSTDVADLETHGISEWSYHAEHRPTVVVWALRTEEVQKVVQIANKYRIPITPYSGGTSLEGHFSSPYGGISLDLSRMDKIIKINEADGDMVVQAGVGWQDVNAELKARGIKQFFPLDPGPGATIGGMAACGCSGTNAVRYGTAKAEWFLNLTVVLPSGEIIKTRQRARKSSAGWDVTKMFIGAEGTLGIVTEATIRLAPLLPTRCAVVNFPSVKDAVAAATEIVGLGHPVQCVEFLDDLMMKAVNQQTGLTFPERDSLFFKFQGSEASMKEVARSVGSVVQKHSGRDFKFSKNEKEAETLWQGRKVALWSAMSLLPGYKCWTTDVCVPISALPTLVEETKADLIKRGLTACHVGHVGDGNVHSLILFKDDAELVKVKEAVHEMVHRAQRLDGTATGEHGVGLGKVEYLEAELGVGTVLVMETIKKTLDPKGLFNPGKLYPNLGGRSDLA